MRMCPRCLKTYNDVPALSRVDNLTQVCPNCGMLEALLAMQIPPSSPEFIPAFEKKLEEASNENQ